MARLPIPMPLRHGPGRLLAVAFFVGIVIVYQLFWDDVSSPFPFQPWTPAQYGGSWTIEAKSRPDFTPWSPLPTKDGNPGRLRKAGDIVAMVMSSKRGRDRKLECPPLGESRYAALRPSKGDSHRFFFALNLRQIVHLLPTLMGSIVEVIRFLGPEHCAVSIVEGYSSDGTFEVLKLLQQEFESMGVDYHLQTSNINPRHGDRIGKLAKLRNLALEPMMANASQWHRDATILFINDVAACAQDILELLHQKTFQDADMTCAMDYHRLHNGRLAFYDVWVSRSMDGDSFFPVPDPGKWTHAWELLTFEDVSRNRFEKRVPFQVFACWNGATAITATPFLDGRLDFRRAAVDKGECGAGEPTLLCKDMWKLGHGKILVVPSVSLGYDVETGDAIKKSQGYTSDWTEKEDQGKLPLEIDWKSYPPPLVRCIPKWTDQFWKPWDHGLD
ncbi:hypothetical protein HIM_06649 [Hirsutella minnesotensis 3608]|uniref:Alpha-1,3-mannosyltransferase CMT1 n=1 Tax=Hirsutella minnesotensis 3608 TaxID=1043627 RepID=A0A0F7ZIS9_9HYPO|nr:hypothetical protein HIM_06649 [Hirsutella minnesotensis 3608]